MENILHPSILIFLIPIVAIIAGVIYYVIEMWFKHKRTEMELALKQEMIQRGMSADDIIKVLQGTKSKRASENDGQAPKVTADYRAKT